MTSQQHHRPATHLGTHAIVIGGSITGLLAARVLADVYTRVTVIERDQEPATATHRRGAPQSHHAHVLLARGKAILEVLFPTLLDDLRDGGAIIGDGGTLTVFVTPQGKLPHAQMHHEVIGVSRVVLEWHIRRLVTALPNVAIHYHHDVHALLSTPDHTRVTGVQLTTRLSGIALEKQAADLIVDASGRHSKLPEWLAALGYPAPPEELITSSLGYASRVYARPADFPATWEAVNITARPPHNPRAAVLLPIEGKRWHVTLGGVAGNHPPTDEAGFLQWARDLPDPSIYEALRVAEPMTPIRGYRTPVNRFRHFERLARWPEGLVALGDSVCAFNPIFGQGMSVSALGAETLAMTLRQQVSPRTPGFERRFQTALAHVIRAPWLIATAQDLRWNEVLLNKRRPNLWMQTLHWYLDQVTACACNDPQTARALLDVLNLLVGPHTLATPRIVARVLVRTLGGDVIRHAGEPFALSAAALAQLRQRPAAHIPAQEPEVV